MEFSRTLLAPRLALLGASLTIAAMASAQSVEGPPTFGVGQKWTYDVVNHGDKLAPYTVTNEVRAVEGGSVWLHATDGRPGANPPQYMLRMEPQRGESVERFEVDAAAPNGAGKQLFDRKRNSPSLLFPLTVGKQYAVKEIWDNNQGFTEYKVEVQAVEKLTFQGKELEVYRIKYSGFWTNTSNNGSTGRAENTRWYAPSLGVNARSEFRNWTSRSQQWNHIVQQLVAWEAPQPK